MLLYLSFGFITLFTLFAFLAGLYLGKNKKRKQVFFLAEMTFIFILFRMILAQKPALEMTLFPWLSYLYIYSYWIYPLCLFFFGLLLPTFQIRWNRLLLFGIAFLLFLLSIWGERWRLYRSFPGESSLQKADSEHHCGQTTIYTCAPSACVSLLSYYEIEATEGEMSRLCLTQEEPLRGNSIFDHQPKFYDAGGTQWFNIYRGLRFKIGNQPFQINILEPSQEELLQLKEPVLVNGGSHALVLKFEGETVIINEPKMGRMLKIDLQTFKKEYLPYFFGGFAYTITPKNE